MPVLTTTLIQRDARPRRVPGTSRRQNQEIGETIRDAIREDAARGQGPSGDLKRYAASTTRQKGTSTPTLRETGRLLDTMQVRALADRVFVKLRAPYARFVVARYDIMGISRRTIARIRQIQDGGRR